MSYLEHDHTDVCPACQESRRLGQAIIEALNAVVGTLRTVDQVATLSHVTGIIVGESAEPELLVDTLASLCTLLCADCVNQLEDRSRVPSPDEVLAAIAEKFSGVSIGSGCRVKRSDMVHAQQGSSSTPSEQTLLQLMPHTSKVH